MLKDYLLIIKEVKTLKQRQDMVPSSKDNAAKTIKVKMLKVRDYV